MGLDPRIRRGGAALAAAQQCAVGAVPRAVNNWPVRPASVEQFAVASACAEQPSLAVYVVMRQLFGAAVPGPAGRSRLAMAAAESTGRLPAMQAEECARECFLPKDRLRGIIVLLRNTTAEAPLRLCQLSAVLA